MIKCRALLLWIDRQVVASDCELFIQANEVYFNDLVEEVIWIGDLLECALKELALDLGGHSNRAIDTDQPRVEIDVGRRSARRGIVCRTAEVRAVPRDERPVSVKNEGCQFPVLPARLAHPYDVRTLRETGVDCNFYKIQTQALIDQKLHGVFTLL